MILAVLLSRFELVIAAGGREVLARGPAALAPEPGREQRIGEVSSSAEAFGVYAGMRLGEALARCPSLALIPPDPMGVADAWEKVVARLESVGAAVESEAPGLAFFDGAPLGRLHGGKAASDPAAALRARMSASAPELPPWLAGVVAAVRAALRLPARIGAGPSRFCAHAGAVRARRRARRPSWSTARRASLPSRSRCCGAGQRSRAWSSPCGAWESRRSASSRRCRARWSPIASGGRESTRMTWRMGAMTSCARASQEKCWKKSWSCRRRGPGCRWSARSCCSSISCWHGASVAAARCAWSSSARGWSRVGHGASASSSVSRWPTRCACASRSARSWCCCRRRPSRCGWRSSASGPPARCDGAV